MSRFVLLLTLGFTTAMAATPDHAGRAFVTSTTGTGNLSSWAELGGGGLTGVAAGDRICQIRAHAGGLAGAENYRAWLSTDSTDAYCHIVDGNGKKHLGCGLPAMPEHIGPWLTVDDRLIIADLDDALFPLGALYHAFDRDEKGDPVPGPAAYTWTGTNDLGVRDPNFGNCSNWTDAGGGAFGVIGRALNTTGTWAGAGQSVCSNSMHLLCMTVSGGNDEVDPVEGEGALAFVTSVTGNANLSLWSDAGGRVGVEAGDQICRVRAAAADLPLPQSFKAFLSAGPGHSAIDRFEHDGPRYRLDGVRIAQDLADLGDGEPLTALNVDENGIYRGFWHSVWTGSDQFGEATEHHCNAWSSAAANLSGDSGDPSAVSRYWASTSDVPCSFDYALYCIADVSEHQVHQIFANGMESAVTP